MQFVIKNKRWNLNLYCNCLRSKPAIVQIVFFTGNELLLNGLSRDSGENDRIEVMNMRDLKSKIFRNSSLDLLHFYWSWSFISRMCQLLIACSIIILFWLKNYDI